MASPSPHTCPHTSAEPPHTRPVQKRFTDAQVRQYVQYIGLPEPFASSPIVSGGGRDARLAREGDGALPLLAALMRFHMAKIPFENIALHYTSARVVTLDMDEVFERMVGSGRGLGGYCFQHNALFGAMLRSLGFDIMATAARVNTACEPVSGYPNYAGASYNAWNHQISIVTINATDYLVDVGMGAWGPMVPVELREGNTGPTIAPRHMRLTRGCIPEYESCRESNKVWHYEARNDEGQPWGPIYCFSTLEFLPVDFRALNWFVSTSRQSWFTSLFLCARLVLDEAGTELVGDLTLFGNGLRRRIGAKVVLELEFKCEADRVKALSDHFGINLSAPEQAAILETATAL